MLGIADPSPAICSGGIMRLPPEESTGPTSPTLQRATEWCSLRLSLGSWPTRRAIRVDSLGVRALRRHGFRGSMRSPTHAEPAVDVRFNSASGNG